MRPLVGVLPPADMAADEPCDDPPLPPDRRRRAEALSRTRAPPRSSRRSRNRTVDTAQFPRCRQRLHAGNGLDRSGKDPRRVPPLPPDSMGMDGRSPFDRERAPTRATAARLMSEALVSLFVHESV